MVKSKEKTPEHTHVLIDLGFVVRAVPLEARRCCFVTCLAALGLHIESNCPGPGAVTRCCQPIPDCTPPGGQVMSHHSVCTRCSPLLQITSRYGTEANKAAVDFSVYGPDGKQVHHEEGVSETEIAGARACRGGGSTSTRERRKLHA